MSTGQQTEEEATSGNAALAGDPTGRVLLVYATRHGSTRDVADAVAEAMRTAGCEVDVRSAEDAPGPAAYDAVVVGGPMIMGWHRQAMRYLKTHRAELQGVPTALFITAASLTDNGETEVDGVPILKDPWLAKAPRTPGKLGYRERYALPAHYLGDVLKEAAPVRPRSVAFFGGCLDLTTMNILEKLFVLLAVGATPGDGRHWEFIRSWGAGLAEELSA